MPTMQHFTAFFTMIWLSIPLEYYLNLSQCDMSFLFNAENFKVICFQHFTSCQSGLTSM